MSQSEHIADLAKALAKAQAKMAGAKKDSKNPHLHTRYADLSSVWEACRSALTENGLSVVQTLDDSDCAENQVCVVTTLLHESGQWIQGRLRMVATRASRQGQGEQLDPQVVGSAITYARRYSLAAIVGVAPEDDDAEAAMQRRSGATAAAPGKFAEKPADGKSSDKADKSVDKAPDKTADKMATKPLTPRTTTAAPEAAAEKQEAKRLANEILKQVHDGVLTSQEVNLHGDIPSVSEALKAGDVERLRRAHRLLGDYLERRQREVSAAEPLPV
jgi:hypothetical protein